MDEFATFFRYAATAVDKTLDELVPSSLTEPASLHRAIRWSLLAGGKRFRPALVLAAGRAFGAAEISLLRTAAATEMIHTYSLIHDDLPSMDDDDLRRGRMTCHKKFGEATAILAGDALQAMAFQAVAGDESLSVAMRLRLISELAFAANRMVAGQQFDLEAEGKVITIEQIDQIHMNKTGALIAASARLGAIIGQATERDLEAVTAFASKLGLLFQITDDLIDVSETTETLGKTAGKDTSSNKATYPGVYGFEESRALAEKLHGETLAILEMIDAPTAQLAGISDFVLMRKS